MPDPTTRLYAGQTLTLVTDANSSGLYWRLKQDGTDPQPAVAISASSTVVLGPFGQDRTYAFSALLGLIVATVGVDDDILADANETGETKIANFSGFGANFKSIPAGYTATVGANSQSILFGTLTVIGTWINAGETRLGPWPF